MNEGKTKDERKKHEIATRLYAGMPGAAISTEKIAGTLHSNHSKEPVNK